VEESADRPRGKAIAILGKSAMPSAASDIVKAILADLEHDTRVDLHAYPIDISASATPWCWKAPSRTSPPSASPATPPSTAQHRAGPWPVLDRLRVAVPDAGGEGKLRDEVVNLTHCRLAEVLAWWAAGCERVENLLHVVPPEQETDDELADAVRLVIEKDPLLRADQLLITVQHGVITLDGYAASDEERHLAERDTWYIPGVQDVVDRIQVGG